jgi:hypothetical protein
MPGTQKWNRNTSKKNSSHNTSIRRRTSSVETVQSDVTRTEIMSVSPDQKLPSQQQQQQGIAMLLQEDVWPLILSYCGPQEMNQLADMHGFFRSIVNQESTWRVLCEQLYKVRTKCGYSGNPFG